ncbi:hypothetical protein D9M71_246980 [compost metagenome]
MRVDLRFVAHATGAQTESFHCPVEVFLPLCPAQWQAFAKGRFVDLHDLDARLFQVHHFVTDRQCQLLRLDLARHVLAGEGPHQHGHGAGKHALKGFFGQALGIADPLDSHGLRAAQVAFDDRRFHAARTIALHPTEAGEAKAVQLLGEVLDHVVAFGLTVYQYVQAQTLLNLYRMADLGMHGIGVIVGRQLALLEGLPRQANRRGLWE